MRVGVLGGTFNPIHNTHLAIARAAREQFRLDRVLFIPAKTPPHKRMDLTLAPAEDRMRMAELAVADIPGAEVLDIELRREGPSYTIDTITALKTRFGAQAEIFFFLGTDQALELPSWHRADELVRLCKFVPVERPGFPLKSLEKLAGRLPEEVLRALRENTLKMPASTTSATEIRRKIVLGEDVTSLIPPSVLKYIEDHCLYRTT